MKLCLGTASAVGNGQCTTSDVGRHRNQFGFRLPNNSSCIQMPLPSQPDAEGYVIKAGASNLSALRESRTSTRLLPLGNASTLKRRC